MREWHNQLTIWIFIGISLLDLNSYLYARMLPIFQTFLLSWKRSWMHVVVVQIWSFFEPTSIYLSSNSSIWTRSHSMIYCFWNANMKNDASVRCLLDALGTIVFSALIFIVYVKAILSIYNIIGGISCHYSVSWSNNVPISSSTLNQTKKKAPKMPGDGIAYCLLSL
jgi:hypothetical protein